MRGPAGGERVKGEPESLAVSRITARISSAGQRGQRATRRQDWRGDNLISD